MSKLNKNYLSFTFLLMLICWGICVLLHCIVNSLLGIYIINDNIWGNITATAILIFCSYAFVKMKGRIKLFN